MSELDKQRQAARDASCEDASLPAKLTAPPARPVDSCEPAVAPLPDVFKTPTPPSPSPAPVGDTPPHVTLENDDLTINCADIENAGPVGVPFTVAQGALQLFFYWQNVPAIKQNQLSYIASLPDSSLVAIKDPAVTLSIVRGITKLDVPQSRYVIVTLAAMRAALLEQVTTLARASIRCVWVNTPQTASCPAGAFTEAPEGLIALISNPVVVDGGSVESTESQSAADTQALALAQSQLSCWFGNDEISVSCVDIGFAEEVPVDEVPVGSTVRVGHVTVEANTFFSQDGKGAVNSQAYDTAVSSLVCFYINTEITRSCADIGFAAGTVVSPTELTSNIPGNPVHVEPGVVESTESTAAANAAAISIADGLLSCVWRSRRVEKECASITITNVDGEEEVVPPSVKSPIKSVVIPEGEISSVVSQADADEQADLMALLQLDCIYCNGLIKPVCLPASIMGQDPFPLPIPIPSSQFDPSWSIDATPGVAKDTFCSSIPLDAILIAHSVGVIPFSNLSTGRSCRFINDEIRVSCVASAGIIGPFDESAREQLSSESYPNPVAADMSHRYIIVGAGAVEIAEDEVPAEFEPADEFRAKHYVNLLARQQALSLINCFFANGAHTFTCAETLGLVDVYPKSTDNILVEAGIFTSTRSKAEAEDSALAFAKSSLNCFYANKKAKYLCADGALDGSYNPAVGGPDLAGYMVYGGGSMAPSGAVSNDSRGSLTKPVIIDEATFTSGVSQAEADLQALVMASSILDCFWSNDPVTVFCFNYGPGAEGVVSIDVAADVFRSYVSKADADAQAAAYGSAQTYCYFNNDEITRGCSSLPGWTSAWIPAPGAVVAVTIPAGSVTSPTSKAAANATAGAIATSGLICQYVNQAQTPDACGAGTSPSVTGVVIPEGTVTAGTTPDANAAAKAMANAIQACAPGGGGSDGAPGNDGGPGSCTGDCVGYYA